MDPYAGEATLTILYLPCQRGYTLKKKTCLLERFFFSFIVHTFTMQNVGKSIVFFHLPYEKNKNNIGMRETSKELYNIVLVTVLTKEMGILYFNPL